MSELYKSPTDYLICEADNKVLTITLNRPDVMNALPVSYTHLTLPTKA